MLQSPDHGQSQRSSVVQNLVDTIALTDHWLQILRRQASLLHTEFDRIYWIGCVDSVMLQFIRLDNHEQQLKAITFYRPWFWLLIKVWRDNFKRCVIIGFRT